MFGFTRSLARADLHVHPPPSPSRTSSHVVAAVLLSEASNARIADLGLATLAEGAEGTATRTHAGGTSGYQAPEVARRKYSSKADMFSLAVMFFEMAVGTMPDTTLTPDETLAPLRGDPETRALLLLMLKMKSDERPTADECARWIEERPREHLLVHAAARHAHLDAVHRREVTSVRSDCLSRALGGGSLSMHDRPTIETQHESSESMGARALLASRRRPSIRMFLLCVSMIGRYCIETTPREHSRIELHQPPQSS